MLAQRSIALQLAQCICSARRRKFTLAMAAEISFRTFRGILLTGRPVSLYLRATRLMMDCSTDELHKCQPSATRVCDKTNTSCIGQVRTLPKQQAEMCWHTMLTCTTAQLMV